uniref:energy transducer TonB n=1 Tax=uncultured Altererythrobacter sp. TaxID=500840 RepID=UPI002614B0C5|nr:energy transducer TonB [uncultured Altererythrobacter sp.]
MAFVDQKSLKERSAGMAGAIIIPAALGAIFISGLAVDTIATIIKDKPFEGVTVKLPPPPPPEEKIEPKPKPDTTSTQVVAPDRPIALPTSDWTVKPIENLPPIGGEVIPLALPPIDTGPAMPSFTPKVATPRNDPGRWVTDSDYRTIWINREWTGTARFSLEINASGRVTNCQITRSTGHNALDNATCQLITKRARFRPATDVSGQAVPSTYSNAISWELPD